MYTTTTHKIHGRHLVCALAACLLTILLLGEIGQAAVQAAQRAVLQQA